MEQQLTKEEIKEFEKSIGITNFSRICLSIHNTMRAIVHILVSPFAGVFDYVPAERKRKDF